jgi:hypothetical protein
MLHEKPGAEDIGAGLFFMTAKNEPGKPLVIFSSLRRRPESRVLS